MEQEKDSLVKEPLKTYNYILDLLFIIILSCIAIVTVFVLPDGNMVRIILGIGFLLICPGYAFISLLWPKKDDISNLERVALSFGLSITFIVIFSLILNYTPWGFGLIPILFSLFSFVIITSLLSIYVRLKISDDKRFFIRFDRILPRGESTKIDKILTILIVMSLIIACIVIVYVVMTPATKESYTEFYILDKNGTSKDYPKNLTVGENGTVIIGVVNHEGEKVNYTVIVNLFNETENKNGSWEFPLILNNNEKYEFNFGFNITSNGTYELEFLLIKEYNDDPYFEIHLSEIIVKD